MKNELKVCIVDYGIGNIKAFKNIYDKLNNNVEIASKKEQLQNLQTPTLLIWGAMDTWIPVTNGKKMNALLPNSKLVVLQNSGHVPMEENPTESLRVLNEFLHHKNN